MPPEPLLDVRNLSVELRPQSQIVLRSVSLQIPEASIVGLCGRSGSGKTTLALALLNLLPPSKYRVSGLA